MKKTLSESVAVVVATARKKTNLSQEELASRSNLDRTYISGIERGVRNITLKSLERVVSGLEMTMADFLKELMNEVTIHDKE